MLFLSLNTIVLVITLLSTYLYLKLEYNNLFYKANSTIFTFEELIDLLFNPEALKYFVHISVTINLLLILVPRIFFC